MAPPALDYALSKLTLPAPVLAEFEVVDPELVRVEFDAPAIEELPDSMPTFLPIGTRGYQRTTRRERRILHWDVTVGVLLRLAHEVLHALPTVERVDLVAMRPIPGSDEMGAVAWSRVHRAALADADLDGVEVLKTFVALGGMLTMTEDHEMPPFPIPAEAS